MNCRSLTYLVLTVLTMAMTGCSTRKNNAASRNYTAFITRYNVYFNGNEHYIHTLAEMEKNYADDYTRTTLLMHPAEAYADPTAPQPDGDFNRSIEKAQKAIQLRSIKKRPRRPGGKSTPESRKWLKREEYNPFLHNAWLLMGRSQYMNGDFLGAASTFHYISKHFRWLPETVTEATLWRARCYLAAGWIFEAESLLNPLKTEDLTNSNLKSLYAYDMASLEIRRRNYREALPFVIEVADVSKGNMKARMTFLSGQLYELTNQPQEAFKAFGKVAGMSGASHRTRFNARIKQSEVYQGNDITKEIKSLHGMTRYEANRQYLDQIYYAIGNLHLSHGDTAKAIDNYRMAIASSTRRGVEAALANLALGQIYFSRGDYVKAQPLYSFAAIRLPETFPAYDSIRSRSDVLDELAMYAHNVTLQDSLLTLSEKSPDEQRKIVDSIIARLEKQEKKEAEEQARSEYLARQNAAGNNLDLTGIAAPSTFALNTDKSWYFYNEAARNAGRSDFRRRWGSRKLEDDWRRRNKTSFTRFGDLTDIETDTTASVHTETETVNQASDPHFPEYYLRQIPSTKAEKANAQAIVQEGLYNMGMILKDKLEDYKAATRMLENLTARFPDNIYRLDAYYNLYLMGVLSNDGALTERYRRLIISDFPESKYAQALSDPDFMEKLRRMPQMEDSLYVKAYEAYFADNNAEVHAIYSEAIRDYPMSRNIPKFMFLEALCYATENKPSKFAEMMTMLTERYPDSDVAPLASSYLDLLASGQRLKPGNGNVRGLALNTRLGAATSVNSPADSTGGFELNPDTTQVVMIIYDVKLTDSKKILFDVARHNFISYSVSDFDIAQMQFGKLGVLVVSGFINARNANSYRSKLESSTVMRLPQGVMPLVISKPDFDRLLEGRNTLEEYLEISGQSRIKQVHETVLPSAEFDDPLSDF